MRLNREDLAAGIASQIETEGWRAERKERRWIDAHPYAVKEFLDAARKLNTVLNLLPSPPEGCDKKTVKVLKRRISQLITELEAYKGALEKTLPE